jgi:hypothetical protein
MRSAETARPNLAGMVTNLRQQRFSILWQVFTTNGDLKGRLRAASICTKWCDSALVCGVSPRQVFFTQPV